MVVRCAPSPAASPNPFQPLGLQGLDRIAPVLVAALVTEAPLLLVGPHGTAKSLLLTRTAAALGLAWRHYNASLLNYDDLVGFPLPGKDGRLEYVTTPAAIWGAGAVIFDEISRCRPEMQNKLFPIIHERRVQGLPLEGLRYRWAAMNPPATEDDHNGYLGSEPLDAALADRFAFVATMPQWAELTDAEQIAVITATDAPVTSDDARPLTECLERARLNLTLLQRDLGDAVAEYVRTLVALMTQAGVTLSSRRAAMLHRAVLAVNAAALAIDPSLAADEAALLAVRNALPQRATGQPVNEVSLLAAHREAWHLANVPAADPLKVILCAADPLERLRLALAATTLPTGEFSRVVADALAQLQPGARAAAIVHLFETGAVGRLNAAVAEQAGAVYQQIAVAPVFSESLHATHARFRTWARVKDLLARLDPADPRAHLHANAIAGAFARKELTTPEDAEQAFHGYGEAERQLRGTRP